MRGGRHRKGHKGKKSRKMRGGVMAGAVGPISVGAMQWGAVDTSSPVNQDGSFAADPYGTKPENNAAVGGRRRKTRKGKSKKGGKRRSRRRTMKGGGWNAGAVNVSGAGYGFAGTTPGVTGGIAPAAGYMSRQGGAPMGDDGVRSA